MLLQIVDWQDFAKQVDSYIHLFIWFMNLCWIWTRTWWIQTENLCGIWVSIRCTNFLVIQIPDNSYGKAQIFDLGACLFSCYWKSSIFEVMPSFYLRASSGGLKVMMDIPMSFEFRIISPMIGNNNPLFILVIFGKNDDPNLHLRLRPMITDWPR